MLPCSHFQVQNTRIRKLVGHILQNNKFYSKLRFQQKITCHSMKKIYEDRGMGWGGWGGGGSHGDACQKFWKETNHGGAQEALTPKSLYSKQIKHILLYFLAWNPKITATYGSTQCRFSQNTLRPNLKLYTSNRDDKQPHLFHMQVTPSRYGHLQWRELTFFDWKIMQCPNMWVLKLSRKLTPNARKTKTFAKIDILIWKLAYSMTTISLNLAKSSFHVIHSASVSRWTVWTTVREAILYSIPEPFKEHHDAFKKPFEIVMFLTPQTSSVHCKPSMNQKPQK